MLLLLFDVVFGVAVVVTDVASDVTGDDVAAVV